MIKRFNMVPSRILCRVYTGEHKNKPFHLCREAIDSLFDIPKGHIPITLVVSDTPLEETYKVSFYNISVRVNYSDGGGQFYTLAPATWKLINQEGLAGGTYYVGVEY